MLLLIVFVVVAIVCGLILRSMTSKTFSKITGFWSEMMVMLFYKGELSKYLINIEDCMDGKFEFLELDAKE